MTNRNEWISAVEMPSTEKERQINTRNCIHLICEVNGVNATDWCGRRKNIPAGGKLLKKAWEGLQRLPTVSLELQQVEKILYT